MSAIMLLNQKPVIRLASEGKLREAGKIVALSFESFRTALPPHILEPYVADASDLAAVSEEAKIMVAEREGAIAGTVTYYEDAGREGMDGRQVSRGFDLSPSHLQHTVRGSAESCANGASRAPGNRTSKPLHFTPPNSWERPADCTRASVFSGGRPMTCLRPVCSASIRCSATEGS